MPQKPFSIFSNSPKKWKQDFTQYVYIRRSRLYIWNILHTIELQPAWIIVFDSNEIKKLFPQK